MKKLVLFLSLFFIGQFSVASVCESFCPAGPYLVSSSFSRFMSNISGSSFISTKLLETKLQSILNREFYSNFNVEIYPYSSKDLKEGKFKSIKIKAKNAKYKGLIISDFNAQTLCDYNQVVVTSDKILFSENTLLDFSAQINAKDFQKIIKSDSYKNLLSKLDVKVGHTTLFKIFGADAQMLEDRILLYYKVLMPFLYSKNEVQDLTLNTGLRVKNGQIIFSDVNLNSKNNRINLNKMLPLINKLNPLSINLRLRSETKSTLKIKTVKINDENIYISGLFIIPKDYTVNLK